MMKCPHCAEDIQDEAKVCKHCGKSVKKKSHTSGCLVVSAMLLLAMGYCMTDQDERTPPAARQQSQDKSQVRLLCQQAIKAGLKSPSSAKMPHISMEKDIGRAKEDPDILRVVTYADAENSFGAMVRTNFQCDCKKVNGKWQVVNLDTF